jgi:hypothetical protein
MINLGGLYSSAGGFINYDSPGGIGVDDPTISAIAADGVTVLATYDIAVLAPINTPNGVNAGAFVGIQDATADIAFLEFSNDYVAIHSITLAGAASTVPEPSGVLLLGSGLALVMAVRRRRK